MGNHPAIYGIELSDIVIITHPSSVSHNNNLLEEDSWFENQESCWHEC